MLSSRVGSETSRIDLGRESRRGALHSWRIPKSLSISISHQSGCFWVAGQLLGNASTLKIYMIYHIHPYTLGHSAQQPSRFHLLPRHRMDPWNFKGTCSASTLTVPSTWRSFPVWIQRKKQPHRLHIEILNAVNINPTSVEPWICQHSASICQHWWRLLLVLACFGHELRRMQRRKDGPQRGMDPRYHRNSGLPAMIPSTQLSGKAAQGQKYFESLSQNQDPIK